MKHLIVYTVLAGFAGALNEVLARQEASWIPGKLELRGGCVATVLEAVPHSSPQSPGSILEFRLIQGDQAEVQAGLEELQAGNPYWKPVAMGIDDHLEAVVLESESPPEDTPVPGASASPAPAAKKAAKKAARNAAASAGAQEIGPAYKLVLLAARFQP